MSCRARDAGAQTNPYSTFMKHERNVTPPTFARLVDEAMCEGARVESAHLEGRDGCWDPAAETIWIDTSLGERAAAAVLAHELEHVRRGDAGPQLLEVEKMIDERVSRRFIDPGQYARAESLTGPAPALIAEELDLPTWVVEAWQRQARRGDARAQHVGVLVPQPPH